MPSTTATTIGITFATDSSATIPFSTSEEGKTLKRPSGNRRGHKRRVTTQIFSQVEKEIVGDKINQTCHLSDGVVVDQFDLIIQDIHDHISKTQEKKSYHLEQGKFVLFKAFMVEFRKTIIKSMTSAFICTFLLFVNEWSRDSGIASISSSAKNSFHENRTGIFNKIANEGAPMFFNIYGLLVGLLTVFLSYKTYERFWEARGYIGKCLQYNFEFTRQLTEYIVFQDNDTIVLMRRMIGWSQAFYWLLVQGLRDEYDLNRIHGLTKDEKERLTHKCVKPNQRSLIVTIWINLALSELEDKKSLSSLHAYLLELSLKQSIRSMYGLFLIKHTGLPMGYFEMLRYLGGIWICFVSITYLPNFGWFSAIPTFCMSFMYFGVQGISEELADPFGLDICDLTLWKYGKAMSKNAIVVCQEPFSKEIKDLNVDTKNRK